MEECYLDLISFKLWTCHLVFRWREGLFFSNSLKLDFLGKLKAFIFCNHKKSFFFTMPIRPFAHV